MRSARIVRRFRVRRRNDGWAAVAIPDGYVDMKNTKCLVLAEEIGGAMGPGEIVTYEGKAYHVCCGSCVAEFKKDPEKYVMAFNADPAKFGVK